MAIISAPSASQIRIPPLGTDMKAVVAEGRRSELAAANKLTGGQQRSKRPTTSPWRLDRNSGSTAGRLNRDH